MKQIFIQYKFPYQYASKYLRYIKKMKIMDDFDVWDGDINIWNHSIKESE